MLAHQDLTDPTDLPETKELKAQTDLLDRLV